MTAYFGKEDRTNFTPNRKGTRTTSAYEEFTVRQFIAFAPMWQAYQQFWVEDGDYVPTTFSRNFDATGMAMVCVVYALCSVNRILPTF
ncbi:MAG: hypothetical protein ACRDI2_11340 [Chloroflexota bacterium]